MIPAPPQSTPGWFPDPLQRYEFRYFNGTAWTGDVSTDGQRYVDPAGTEPTVAGQNAQPVQSQPVQSQQVQSQQVQYGANVNNPAMGSTPYRSGAATASVVLGVIAVLISWVPFIVFIGIVLAIVAIALGATSRRRAAAANQANGAGVAGMVCGAIALAVAIFGVWLTVIIWTAVSTFANPGPVSVIVDECSTDTNLVTVSGAVTNTSDTTRSYTVFATVEGNQTSPQPELLADVKPRETRDVTVEFVSTTAPESCDAELVVLGPLPFGIEMEPPTR